MVVSRTLLAVLAVFLVAGSGLAATGLAQTDTGESSASMNDLEMDATLGTETVTVTVTDDGSPVVNASITLEGEEEVTLTTDADGTATVNRSALTDENNSLAELEVEYESDHAEGTLEYVIRDGSLILVEEKYEYEIDEVADEEDAADDDESDADDEREDPEEDNDGEDGDDDDEDEDEEGEDEDDVDDATEDGDD